MARKFVIETAQVIKRTYYVEIEDPMWAMDSIVCQEVEEYAQTYLTEDILSHQEVDQWPVVDQNNMIGYDSSINGAVCVYDANAQTWNITADWSLAKLKGE